MIPSRILTRAGAIGATSLLIAVACERAKSSAAVDTSAAQASASSTPPRGVVPESSPDAMRAFAAAHLRPGLKPGDFLTNKADYPTGDTADVYRAVLDTLYVSKDGFPGQDRKSTRLNSSHSSISYAVFCLKKKKKKE